MPIARDQIQAAAENAWLQVGARIAMVVFTVIGAPITLYVIMSISGAMGEIRSAMHSMQLSSNSMKGDINQIKAMSEQQLHQFEDRLSAQSRRMDTQDGRIERLERPFFDGRRGGPASP